VMVRGELSLRRWWRFFRSRSMWSL